MAVVKLSETDALLLLQKDPQPFYKLVGLGQQVIRQQEAQGISMVRDALQKHYEDLFEDDLVEKEDRGRTRYYWLSINGLQVKKELLKDLAKGKALDIAELYENWREEEEDES